jgi:hypothetical protein
MHLPLIGHPWAKPLTTGCIKSIINIYPGPLHPAQYDVETTVNYPDSTLKLIITKLGYGTPLASDIQLLIGFREMQNNDPGKII